MSLVEMENTPQILGVVNAEMIRPPKSFEGNISRTRHQVCSRFRKIQLCCWSTKTRICSIPCWRKDSYSPQSDQPPLPRSSRSNIKEPVLRDDRAPAERFMLPDSTQFGIISSTTAPFCRSCDRSRLTSDGIWYLCLHAKERVNLKSALRIQITRMPFGRALTTPLSLATMTGHMPRSAKVAGVCRRTGAC